MDTTLAVPSLFEKPARRISGVVLPVILGLVLCARAYAAPVDVNAADAASLADALTGVGPKIAAAIVEYREANGPFTSADDLLNVKGVGPKVLEKNKSDILLDSQASDSAAD